MTGPKAVYIDPTATKTVMAVPLSQMSDEDRAAREAEHKAAAAALPKESAGSPVGEVETVLVVPLSHQTDTPPSESAAAPASAPEAGD